VNSEPIPFNRPALVGDEFDRIRTAIEGHGQLSGEGYFSRSVCNWFSRELGSPACVLTPSCTAALEMAAILADIGPGDEVILPSFTFVSSASAFALRGARLVFVDIEPGTMNLDPACVAAAITPQTRAIVPVHYAGVACDMVALQHIAKVHDLLIIEDAAHALRSSLHGRPCGAWGDLACFSFHETKNVSCGEGGLLAINRAELVARAEIVRDKGTNRRQFLRGEIDRYSWVELGSSFLASDLQAAFLSAQLDRLDELQAEREGAWDHYRSGLASLAAADHIELPVIPADRHHSAHCFWLRCRDRDVRAALIAHLRARDIAAVFHYVPLHSSPAGRRHGRFHGEDRHTTSGSERLMRLPLWHGIGTARIERVIDAINGFFGSPGPIATHRPALQSVQT
jgi:dTDP-4-amino-4,6-dideoxygalactose transaminase